MTTKQTQKAEEIKQFIDEKLKDVLKEGVTYYSTPVKTSYGVSGGMLHYYEHGEKKWDRASPEFVAFQKLPMNKRLFKITSCFEPNTKVKYTFQKGLPMQMEAYDAAMLLAETKQRCLTYLSKEELNQLDLHVKFVKKKELKLEEDFCEIKDGESRSFDVIFVDDVSDNLTCLYKALEGKIKKISISAHKEEPYSVTTLPAFPELGLEQWEDQTDISGLDATNLEAIYGYLESHNETKIKHALHILDKQADFKKQAEQRYLPLIQARLNDKKASLQQFSEAALSSSEVSKILSKHHTGKDFIAFTYMNEDESKLMVDFMGALLANVVDIEELLQQATASTSTAALATIMEAHASTFHAFFKQQTTICPEGWYAKICKKLGSIQLAKVMFEKTSFVEANKSLVLREYMLFLNMLTKKGPLYFDIHQSDQPDLTPAFWLFNNVPSTNWSDVKPSFPESPLSYARSGKMRRGDSGSWETITST